MSFDFYGIMMDPFVLMFITVATGLLFGKVKFGKFSLGTSGALFTGLLIGWAIYNFGSNIIDQGEGTAGYAAATKMISESIIHSHFFNTSLILFVAAVGLLAAKDMGIVLKKYGAKFIVLGMVITFVGAAVTYGATALISSTNAYEVAGVYTGALTSSPGLGAAIETAEGHAISYSEKFETLSDSEKNMVLQVIAPDGSLTADNTTSLTEEMKTTYISNAVAGVGVGHAIGYPFGVIVVIFAVNFFANIFKMDVDEEKRRFKEEMDQARSSSGSVKEIPVTPFSILSFTIVCALGYVVGNIKISMGSLGYFSLGATGGVLIIGLVLGNIGRIGKLSFRMDPKTLSVLRDLCLVFFLGIVGLKYGYRTFDAIMGAGIALAATSFVVGVLAMLIGFLIGRYVFKLNWIMLSGAICGGMTSTPGLGAAIDALDSDDPAAGYGATYPFALLGMIIFTIVIHKLPLL